jgi:hypothetical protein
MLRAQRRQDRTRALMVPGTDNWDEATDLLDALNDQLRHLASAGTLPLESLGNGLDLDLDSRPEDDMGFRASVVRCVRSAILAERARSVEHNSRKRLDSSTERVWSTLSLMDRVQRTIREGYPGAVVNARPSRAASITIVADRDGLSA